MEDVTETLHEISGEPVTFVKTAPTTESSYGAVFGAGACILGAGAIALYKLTRKRQAAVEEPLLAPYAADV